MGSGGKVGSGGNGAGKGSPGGDGLFGSGGCVGSGEIGGRLGSGIVAFAGGTCGPGAFRGGVFMASPLSWCVKLRSRDPGFNVGVP